MAMNVEVYQALKSAIGAENAAVVASALPPAGDLATKADLTGAIAGVKAESARTLRWVFTLFVPVWAGTSGTLVAVLLRY